MAISYVFVRKDLKMFIFFCFNYVNLAKRQKKTFQMLSILPLSCMSLPVLYNV